MPRGLRFGICTDQNMSWPETVERWKYLEDLGFDSIWLCDHLIQPSRPVGPYFEGSTLLAGLAAVTERARIGVLVWSNTFRHPSILAKESVTIDHIANGRLEVGIGAGWYVPEHEKFGLEYLPDGQRVAQFREQVTRRLDGSLTDTQSWVYNGSVTFKPDETVSLTGGLETSLDPSADVPGDTDVGLTLSGETAVRVRELLSPLRDLFAAIFFVSIGFMVDPAVMIPMLPLAVLLALVTAATKVVSGMYAAKRDGIARPGQLRAGAALIVRGEFSLVIIALVGEAIPVIEAIAMPYVFVLAFLGPVATVLSGRIAAAPALRRRVTRPARARRTEPPSG